MVPTVHSPFLFGTHLESKQDTKLFIFTSSNMDEEGTETMQKEHNRHQILVEAPLAEHDTQ